MASSLLLSVPYTVRIGIRTQVKVKLGRQNFYLYSTVNPGNGESSSLLARNVSILIV
ncbi:hypothetical protein GO684_01465 [Wolbachia endosymbiont of Litomosoides brasiliensis]|nr:hypothetical protein [Wolbachia endosymbiont of Litomosoides brasiliensis]NUY39373.1 hypothetical protein [Wolbachia endosymbiont of Litomosoides brasiliensis]